MTPGQNKLEESLSPIVFDTANDLVGADKQIALQIPALGPVDYQARPYCLEKSQRAYDMLSHSGARLWLLDPTLFSSRLLD